MKFRKMMAIGGCALMLGGVMSVVGAGPASGKIYATCSQKIATEEKQAAKDYAKGKLTAAEYDNIMSEIAYHKELWGC